MKNVVLGWPGLECTEKISMYNLVIAITMYSIFKINCKVKYEKGKYDEINIEEHILRGMIYYRIICKNEYCEKMLNLLIMKLNDRNNDHDDDQIMNNFEY